MAGLKVIRNRIRSVKNTKKITYAMKLVSAAKLKKAQDLVVQSRQYTRALQGLLSELASEGLDFSHPLLEKHPETRSVTLVVVGGSRGLCGAYNSNIFKATDAFLARYHSGGHSGSGQKGLGIPVKSVLIGKKPAEYFRRQRYSYQESFENLVDDASQWPLEEISRKFERSFIDGQTDEVHLIYTRFKSALSQVVETVQLLPMEPAAISSSGTGAQKTASGLTLFEPSVQAVFTEIVPRILRSTLRQACLESKTSEHGARMTAMDSATSNASDLIDGLTLKLNKLRQTGITADLLDIIGGAAALDG